MFNLSVFDLWGICQLCKHFYLRGGAKKFKVEGGGGLARVDSFIRLKNHYLKNALKCFTIFYACDFLGQSLCQRYI